MPLPSLAVFCRVDCCCCSSVSQLGRTVDGFPPLGDYRVLSGTMELDLRMEAFRSGSAHILQVLCLRMWYLHTLQDLPSERAIPWVIVIASIIWVVSWTT